MVLSPKDITERQRKLIPPFVTEAIDNLLAQKFDGSSAVFSLKEATEAIKDSMPVFESFKSEWLNFEPIYREAGWKVVFDRPGCNEDYPATYRFSQPQAHSCEEECCLPK